MDRRGRLLGERQEIEGRLRELDEAPVKSPNPASYEQKESPMPFR
jgi:hypothetical protein